MPLTAQQHQQLIVLEVGDDAAGTLAGQMALLWTACDDQPTLERQALATKLRAIDVMLGRVRQQVNFRALDGASVNLSDLTAHLQAMRAHVQRELDAQERGQVSAPAGGALATDAPITGTPDPNGRALRGDPLRPPPGRRFG